MTLKAIANKIIKLGGTVEITTTARGYQKLAAILNDHDIDFSENISSFFTVRHIKDRGSYDQGSDYNPGNYHFCYNVYMLENVK